MKRILIILFIILIVFLGYTTVLFYFADEPQLENIGHITLLDRHGRILTDSALPWWYSVEYRWSLDTPLVKAIIAIEDNRYYEHSGLDIIGKIWAVKENIAAGWIVRWGSTIPEQYVKNLYYPSADRSLWEKIQESSMGFILSLKYSKEELLRKYLNSVYMGNGLYGIQSAIDVYFGGRNPNTMSEWEIIEIITRIHSPNIGRDGVEYAKKIDMKLYDHSFTGSLDRKVRKIGINLFPHLTSRIQSEEEKYCAGRENSLYEFVPNRADTLCQSNLLTLTTSIDLNLSLFARDALEGIVSSLEKENVSNGSVYIFDPEKSEVLAYIGNRSASSRENAIDMIEERRSVGSVLKPFIYSLAIDGGADGESLIMDDTRIYKTADTAKSFIPENYIPKTYGPVRLKEALGNSLNSATVRLAETIGIGRIYEAYRKAWLSLDHDAGYYGYGIALGSVEVTLENVVHAYLSLISEESATNFLLADILSDGKNRSRTFWISSILNTSIPLAVKTGTSTDFHDNWAIGYHRDAIIGVWVGNADQSMMEDVSGVSGAGPIFHAIAEYMIREWFIKPHETKIPEWIEKTSICLDNACMRKENVYKWKKTSNLSRVLDKKFIEGDFITSLTEEERVKWKIH